MNTPSSHLPAIEQAAAEGFTHVTTLGGDVPLCSWVRRDEIGLTFENGCIYSQYRELRDWERDIVLARGGDPGALKSRDAFACVKSA